MRCVGGALDTGFHGCRAVGKGTCPLSPDIFCNFIVKSCFITTLSGKLSAWEAPLLHLLLLLVGRCAAVMSFVLC